MRCIRLRTIICRLAILASCPMMAGCTSTMNGYVTNASGQSYYEQGNYVAAAAEFEQAMLSNPANPDYMANLAKARTRMGDSTSAERLYRQALTVAPSHQPSYHGMAELLVTQGRGQEAAGLLQTWAATQPYVAESHLELAWLQRQMGQHDAAAASLQNALQVNPGHATAMAHLGQYYQDIGRPDQAVTLYQRSLQSDWDQPEVHSRLAAAAHVAGGGHPMAATAMARGVDPYGIPRQPSVFGPPSQGAQFAQMQQAQQWQMAQAGMGPTGSPAAWTAAQGGGFPAPYASMPYGGSAMNASFAGQGYAGQGQPGPHTGMQTALSPPMVPPSAAMDLSPPQLGGGWQVVPGSLKVMDSGPISAGGGSSAGTSVGMPQPTPDPSFSQAAAAPMQSISYAPASQNSPAASAAELSASFGSGNPAAVEAF